MWSEQGAVSHRVLSGSPPGFNNSAAALLAYDVPHRAPWDWRVSLYTWTKGIAAGAYLVAALLVVFGLLPETSLLWQWFSPLAAGVFLALTGMVLIADLEHPLRFYMIFTHAQWKSWLVKGAFIITAYSAVLAGHLVGSWFGVPALQRALVWPGVPSRS